VKKFYLSLSTWCDHTYASIADETGDTEYRVTYVMTKKDAKKFNDWDGYSTYSKGDRTERFWSEEDAMKAAIRLFNRKRKARRWILYRAGMWGFTDVGPEPLAGPRTTVARLHRSWARRKAKAA
jgi:hypothetical protein